MNAQYQTNSLWPDHTVINQGHRVNNPYRMMHNLISKISLTLLACNSLDINLMGWNGVHDVLIGYFFHQPSQKTHWWSVPECSQIWNAKILCRKSVMVFYLTDELSSVRWWIQNIWVFFTNHFTGGILWLAWAYYIMNVDGKRGDGSLYYTQYPFYYPLIITGPVISPDFCLKIQMEKEKSSRWFMHLSHMR